MIPSCKILEDHRGRATKYCVAREPGVYLDEKKMTIVFCEWSQNFLRILSRVGLAKKYYGFANIPTQQIAWNV